MILGAEIAMVILGIYALAAGKLTLTKKRVVRGTPARMLGIIAILPITLGLGLAIVITAAHVAAGNDPREGSFRWVLAGIEGGLVVLCMIAIYTIGWSYAGPPDQKSNPRRSRYADPRWDECSECGERLTPSERERGICAYCEPMYR